MFRYRRQLRRWTARVLLVWLFGVAVGVAHACIVAPAAGIHDDGYSLAVAEAHSDDDDHEHAADTSGVANCQDFCVKTSTSLPGSQKSGDGFDPGVAPLPLAAGLLPAVRPSTLTLSAEPSQHRAPIPIPISLLRLAL